MLARESVGLVAPEDAAKPAAAGAAGPGQAEIDRGRDLRRLRTEAGSPQGTGARGGSEYAGTPWTPTS